MAGAIYTEEQLSIARAFAEVRRAAGMKQIDLAAAIGKRQSYISDIERGQRRVDVLELYAIARALNLEPVELYARLIRDVPEDFQL
jgi:transcriptional regulator with XRE-family HTH domain